MESEYFELAESMALHIKICRNCGKEFSTTRSRRVNCLECSPYAPYKHPTRKCPVCGNKFRATDKGNAKQITCSRKCKTIYAKGKLRKDNIEEDLLRAIKEHGTPKSINELCKWAHTSEKALVRRGIKLNTIKRKAGLPVYRLPRELAVESKKAIYSVFSDCNIRAEHKFDGLRRKIALRVDYYIPEYNLVVEIDDMSHYGKDAKERDKIKNDYCKKHGIRLLRIKATKNCQPEEALVKTRLLLGESSTANFFNCWKGSQMIPISNQD